MELKIFGIKDNKVNAFIQIKFFRTEEEAVRAFAQAANDPKDPMFMYAEDFVLYCLGKYDDTSGIISPYSAPISVISAAVASSQHNEFYAARQISKSNVA